MFILLWEFSGICIYHNIYIHIYIDETNHKLFVVIENGGLNMVLMPCFSRKHDDEPEDNYGVVQFWANPACE